MMTIESLIIYPVKSLAGQKVSEIAVDNYGLAHDREWMLIDENDHFVTQREHPVLSQVHVEIFNDHLSLKTPKSGEDQVPFESFRDSIFTKVWDDTIPVKVSALMLNRLNELLGKEIRIVRSIEGAHRNPKHNRGQVRLSDKFPILLVNTKSVDHLNEEYGTQLTPYHFRPNIITTLTRPFDEDKMDYLQTAGIDFRGEESCKRCMMINVNPGNGEWQRDNLKSLGQYRNGQDGIRFGRHLSPGGAGKLSVGDTFTWGTNHD